MSEVARAPGYHRLSAEDGIAVTLSDYESPLAWNDLLQPVGLVLRTDRCRACLDGVTQSERSGATGQPCLDLAGEALGSRTASAEVGGGRTQFQIFNNRRRGAATPRQIPSGP